MSDKWEFGGDDILYLAGIALILIFIMSYALNR